MCHIRTKDQSQPADSASCASSARYWLFIGFGVVALCGLVILATWYSWWGTGHLVVNAATGAINKDSMLVAGLAAVVIAQIVDGRDADSSSFFPGRIILLAGVAFARGEFWILPVQALIMCTIVYRSSVSAEIAANKTPKANVLRCGLGVMALHGAQSWLQAHTCGLLCDTLVNICFGYISANVSDYCFHRFIWHAHWVHDLRGIDRWMWQPIKLHYVQHFIAHHRHSEESREILKEMGDAPESRKRAVATQYTDVRTLEGLACTNHGITVGAPTEGVPAFKCMLAFVLMHTAMPSGSAALLQCATGNWGAALVHVAAIALPGFVVVHHGKYHAASHEVKRYAEAQPILLEWFWNSSEMRNIMAEHKKHHIVGDKYYGLLPFNRYFIYPIFQQW